jgi:hypothetical protein
MNRSSVRTATYISTDLHQLFVISASIPVITLVGLIFTPRRHPEVHFNLVSRVTFQRRSDYRRQNTINAWIVSLVTMPVGVCNLLELKGRLLISGMRSNLLLFKHDMALALAYPYPRTPHYSPMLHNAILAIALGLSDDPYLRLPSTRAIFGTQAKSFIEEEGMTPSVATVQAFAHIASYHSLGAEHNLGWLYIGMALRCGIARECLMCDTC